MTKISNLKMCGERIASLIKKSGLSHRKLAKKINVAPTTVQSIELGKNISVETLCKFAEYFNQSLDYLIYGKLND